MTLVFEEGREVMRNYIFAVILSFSHVFAGWQDYFSPDSLVDGEGGYGI